MWRTMFKRDKILDRAFSEDKLLTAFEPTVIIHLYTKYAEAIELVNRLFRRSDVEMEY